MVRVSSDVKIEEWTRRLARYEASSETVARFCHREGVSVPSFYVWKKKLRPRPASSVAASPRFVAVQITPTVPVSTRRETVVRLGRGIRIEFGSDLQVVEAVVKQLLQTADAPHTGNDAC